MRVTYLKNIVEEINYAIDNSYVKDTELEAIYLSREEWSNFLNILDVGFFGGIRPQKVAIMEPIRVVSHYDTYSMPNALQHKTTEQIDYRGVHIRLEYLK